MDPLRKRLSKSGRLDPITHICIVRRSITAPGTLHLHDYYELEIILSGTGEQNLNGSVYPLAPGTVSFLTPIDFHAVIPHGELRLLNLAFDETLVSPALQSHFLNRREDLIFSSPEEAESLAALISRLEKECALTDGFSPTARADLVELILFPIARSIRHTEDLPRTTAHRVQDSMRYLFRHFRQDITLAQVAEQSGYTPNYFSHLFHRTCGIRFVDFLTRLRLNYARTMLASTQASVAQIAQASGFSSPSNFFRAFRKENGLSPLEYRTQNQKEEDLTTLFP